MTAYTNPVISTHRAPLWIGGTFSFVVAKNAWGADGLITSTRVIHRKSGFATRSMALCAARRWVKANYHSGM